MQLLGKSRPGKRAGGNGGFMGVWGRLARKPAMLTEGLPIGSLHVPGRNIQGTWLPTWSHGRKPPRFSKNPSSLFHAHVCPKANAGISLRPGHCLAPGLLAGTERCGLRVRVSNNINGVFAGEGRPVRSPPAQCQPPAGRCSLGGRDYPSGRSRCLQLRAGAVWLGQLVLTGQGPGRHRAAPRLRRCAEARGPVPSHRCRCYQET